jgi:hypothetical protein
LCIKEEDKEWFLDGVERTGCPPYRHSRRQC